MGIFQNNNQDFVYPPKVGEELEVVIVGAVERIKNDNPEGNYMAKGQKNMGYYDVVPVIVGEAEKKLKISTWKMYFALKDINPDEGDTILIAHPATGEYKITKK